MIEYDDTAIRNNKIQEQVEAAIVAAGYLPYNGYGQRPFVAGIHDTFWIYPAIPPFIAEDPGHFLWFIPITVRERVTPDSFAQIQIRIPGISHPDDNLIVLDQNESDGQSTSPIVDKESVNLIYDIEVVLYKDYMKEPLENLLHEIEKILRPEDPDSIRTHVRVTIPLR